MTAISVLTQAPIAYAPGLDPVCSYKATALEAAELENHCTRFMDRQTAYVPLGISPQLRQKRQAGEPMLAEKLLG